MKYVQRTSSFRRQTAKALLRAWFGGFLLILACNHSAWAEDLEPIPAQIEVIHSDEEAVILEFHLGDYTITSQGRAGMLYHQVDATGMVQSSSPDIPQVPTLGTMIGVPTAAGVTFEVIDASVVDLTGYNLRASPRYTLGETSEDGTPSGELIEQFDAAPAWQDYNDFLPQSVMSIGKSGHMRAQPVAQIQFYPVQYNPSTGQLKLYQRIRARVTWRQNIAHVDRPLPDAGTSHEALLQSTLINYAEVMQMRRDTMDTVEPTVTNASTADPADLVDRRANMPYTVYLSFISTERPTYERLAKIRVKENGIYQIGYDDLRAANIDKLQDPMRLALFNRGKQIHIEVRSKQSGSFSPGDSILFYGTKIRDEITPCLGFNEPKPDHSYTKENVYWLVLMNFENGLRMKHVDGSPDESSTPAGDFPLVRHFEEDTKYWQTMPGQECEERWFWGQRLSDVENLADPDPDRRIQSSRNFQTDLGELGIDTPSLSATISVTLKGYSQGTHYVNISVNNSAAEAISIDGRTRKTESFSIPQRKLTQTIMVEAGKSSQPGETQFYIDSINVEYRQRYSTSNPNEFLFGKSVAPAEEIEIGSLDPLAEVYDITYPLTPTRVTNLSYSPSGKLKFKSLSSDGPKMIACQGNLFLGRCYLAITEEAFKRPEIEAAKSSTLISTKNRAKYVIITHDDFLESAQVLADYRQAASGLTTQVVTVASIFDEFNDGISNPKAIRDFLDYAYHCWNQNDRLEYVLLMGDANQDYKNSLGENRNYVPSFNFESTLFGEISSDSWFANMMPSSAFNCTTRMAQESERDTLSDLFIGRMSVSSPQQANDVITKIRTYEQTSQDDKWKKEILFVSDDEERFRTIVNRIQKETDLASYMVTELQVMDQSEDNTVSGQASDAKAKEIIAAFNSGKLLINYIGHGDFNAWGRWDAADAEEYHYIFHSDDVQHTTNSARLPVVTVSNCLNGFFAGPNNKPSMAESLLFQPGGGAVAVWATTGLGYPSGHQLMLKSFHETIFGINGAVEQRELGVAAQIAMIETIEANSFWAELASTYVLFGDPAMKIGSPKK